MPEGLPILINRAYEGDQTRQLMLDLDMVPYDRAFYKKRNEIERLFRRLKSFRRISSYFEKLDVEYARYIIVSDEAFAL